jgi:hypothetical protein
MNPAPANAIEWSIIERNLIAISDAFDAVNDLLMAEGAFQLVNGNSDRASAITHSVTSGKNIPLPEIINTQQNGTDHTNRIMMHFSPVYPTTNGSPDTGKNIRAKLEATVETFLSDYFGDLNDYRCKAVFIDDSPVTDIIVRLSDLNLSYSDLVNLAGKDPFTQDGEMARRVKIVARNTTANVKYGMIMVYFDDAGPGSFKTFAQFHAVADTMARFLKSVKPLRPSDFTDPQTRSVYVDNFDLPNTSYRYKFLKEDVDALNTALVNARNAFISSSSLADFYALRDVLQEASVFEFKRLVLDYNTQPGTDEFNKLKADSLEMSNLLVAKYQKFEATTTNSTHTYERLVKESTLFFGENFKVLPLFDYNAQQQQVFSNQYNTVTGAAAHSLLTDTGLNIPSSMTVEQYMDEWLQGAGVVRNNIGLLEELRVLRPLINNNAITDDPFVFKAVQYPFGPAFADERLMSAKHDIDKRQTNRTSFAMNMFAGFFGNSSASPLKAGFKVDEWVESIPEPEQNAAVAFHFNAPIAKAPQCLLLAMSPDLNGSWNWNDLRDMVSDVLTTAKLRAVDYEEIAKLKARILSLNNGFTLAPDSSHFAMSGV